MLPVVHENDAVRDLAREAHFVRDAHHGHAFLRELDHDVEHFVDHLRVERGGRFVEQHAIGSMHSARAIATRCCWPPESWPGYLSRLRAEAHPVEQRRSLRARLVLPAPEHLDLRQRQVFAHRSCAGTARNSGTPCRCARAASAGRSSGRRPKCRRRGSRPSGTARAPLTHLIRVDFPDPEGPQTTTTSPLPTLVEQSLSTWKVPYHLLISLISIMVQVFPLIIGRWRFAPAALRTWRDSAKHEMNRSARRTETFPPAARRVGPPCYAAPTKSVIERT